jgi:hypothetical protein
VTRWALSNGRPYRNPNIGKCRFKLIPVLSLPGWRHEFWRETCGKRLATQWFSLSWQSRSLPPQSSWERLWR